MQLNWYDVDDSPWTPKKDKKAVRQTVHMMLTWAIWVFASEDLKRLKWLAEIGLFWGFYNDLRQKQPKQYFMNQFSKP